MQAVELPSAYDIATRGTFPASYAGRPSSYSSHSRTNRTRSSTSSNMYATARKGSAPGASRGSPRASPQKRAATNSAAVKKPSEEQGARSSLQPTARSSNKSSTTASSTTTAQQPGAGGHSYPKSPRHNSNSSSKSHNHQQQQGTRRSSESLPPRLRNSVEHNTHSSKKHHQHQHKKTSTSSSSNTSSSQAKGSKDSSVQPSSSSSSSSADPPNPAPSAPPTISVTLTQAQSDEVEAGEKNSVNDENTTVHVTSRSKLHKNMRSSADSGHCEDFNSSCESDSPSSLPTTDHQQQEEMELVSMVISSGVESDHGASDACDDDDVFVDALSNIPSENSSAYVTPYSTRSQSPAPQEISEISENGSSTLPSLSSSAKDPSSSLNSQDSIERVRVSLQKVLDLRLASAGSSSSSSTTVELDDATSPTSDLEAAVVDRNLESCDSQVTILGSSTKGEGSSTKSTPCSITFIHPSSVFDIDDEDRNLQSSINHSPAEFRTTTPCRPRCLSKDISNIFIGEMELDVSSDADDDSAVDFMSRSRSPSFPLGEEDNDSGCATSIGSPDKITSSLDFKRPGLIHVPVELLLQMEEESNKNGERAGSRGDGVFSQGESSGLNLELSNSDEAQDENQRTQIEGEGRDSDSDGGKDEWPDLFSGENSVPPHSAPGSSYDNNTSTTSMFDYPGASLSMLPPPPPSMNGFVHPPFPFMPPMPPSSTSNNNGSKSDSDPSQIMASINSHVRQQQQAVYQQHQLMFSNGGYPPMGPPPPPPPHHVHGQMFPPAGPRGGPTGFMGFFPPPPPFSLGPGFPPLPPHPPMGGDFLPHPPPPLLPPTTLAPPIQPPPQPRPPSSQLSAENTNEDDTQDSSLSQQSSPQSTPASFSPPPSPALCEKHQLCSTWVMWYDKITGSGRGQMCDYKNSLKNLSTIDSIENFWGTYNNIVPPSGLDKCANYHFFKEGIFPLWEDEANKQGGKWVLTIKDDPGLLDQAWMEVLLMLIGGGMEQFDNVNGVVVSRRKKGDRISLWTKKRTKKASLKVCVELVQSLCVAFEVVGEEAKQFVQELAENQHGISLAYFYHSDSLKSGNSYSNEQHIKLKDHLDAILQDLNL